MKIILKLIVPVITLALGAFFMRELTKQKEAPKKFDRPPLVKAVVAQVVALQDHEPEITAHGRVRSEQPVQLSAEVSGTVQPEVFKFKEGVHFKKGQVLIKLDDRSAKLRLKSSISDLLNATAAVLPELKSELPDAYPKWKKFFESLSFKKLPSLPEATEQKEKMYLSRFNFYKLYFAAENNRILLEKHNLTAPFNGTIVSSNIRPGAAVNQGMLLGTIVNTGVLEIEIPLSASEARLLNKNEPVEIKISESGVTQKGKVDRVSQSITDKNQSVSVYVRLNGTSSRKILDGMFAEVTLKADKIPASFAYPKKYLVDGSHIYKVKGGRLEKSKVENIIVGEGTAYITSGVSQNDTVVVESIQDAINNMPVNPVINGVAVINPPEKKKGDEGGKGGYSGH